MSGPEWLTNVRIAGFGADFRFNRTTLCLYRLDHGFETLVEKIGRRALEVLNVLIEHQPETVAERELLSRVWGPHADSRNLDVQISNLRRILEEGAPKDQLGCVIKNVPRRGYCIAPRRVPYDLYPSSAASPEPGAPANPYVAAAVLKASSESLRGFTEEQQKTIDALRETLDITNMLLYALCRLALDNEVPLEQLRDEVIRIAHACRQELNEPPLSGLRGREVLNLLGARLSREFTLKVLGDLKTLQLQQAEDGVYMLKSSREFAV